MRVLATHLSGTCTVTVPRLHLICTTSAPHLHTSGTRVLCIYYICIYICIHTHTHTSTAPRPRMHHTSTSAPHLWLTITGPRGGGLPRGTGGGLDTQGAPGEPRPAVLRQHCQATERDHGRSSGARYNEGHTCRGVCRCSPAHRASRSALRPTARCAEPHARAATRGAAAGAVVAAALAPADQGVHRLRQHKGGTSAAAPGFTADLRERGRKADLRASSIGRV